MDAAASIPPSGMTDTLYVKFGRTFNFGDEFLWGGYTDIERMMFIFTPSDEYPTESFQVRAFRNFLSEERLEPFLQGDIIKIVNVLEAVDVSGFQSEFNL